MRSPKQMEPVGFSTGCLYRQNWPLEGKIEFFRKLGADNLEIGFLGCRDLLDFKASEQLIDLAGGFKRVSIHAPAYGFTYGKNNTSDRVLEKFLLLFGKFKIDALVVHPENIDDFTVLEKTGLPFLIENMDGRKDKWTTPREFEQLAKDYPFGFLLDTQHIYEHDGTMKLGLEFVEALWSRLKQMHVSGCAPGEIHYPLHLADNRYVISKFLSQTPSVPKIAEGVLTGNLKFTAKLERDYLMLQCRKAVLQ